MAINGNSCSKTKEDLFYILLKIVVYSYEEN